jgi:DNA-directed RNA polymerase specialized sigma24 family protein
MDDMIQRNPHGGNHLPESGEWREFRAHAEQHRHELERSLRRRLVHDPRAATARVQNLSVRDLADESLAWTLDQWRAKPTGTSPAQWMRKRGLQILDEALDREALAAESRAEERAAEGRQHARDLLQDDEERSRWLDLLAPDAADETEEPFDGLTSDPDVSSVESRLDETERLLELDRALLRLPEVRRRVVVHRYLDGFDRDDIAYLLDLTADEVDRELAAAVKALRLDLAVRS